MGQSCCETSASSRTAAAAGSPALKLMEAHKSIKAANLSVSFRSSTKFPQIPADSVESCSVEEALSLTSTGLTLTSTGLEVSLVRPGTAAYVGNTADIWCGPNG